MGSIVILNGSPRAPRSNSKQYAQIFSVQCPYAVEYFDISKTNHRELCQKIGDFSDVLLVFPLYADALPVTLLNFLKILEQNPPARKPAVSIAVNCGFLEPRQNDAAVRMIELFCRQNSYRFGSVLKIGGGEGILNTPFKILVVRKMKKLADSIVRAKYRTLEVTMPLTQKMYIKASASYWIKYGAKNGVTKEQMETMIIEK